MRDFGVWGCEFWVLGPQLATQSSAFSSRFCTWQVGGGVAGFRAWLLVCRVLGFGVVGFGFWVPGVGHPEERFTSRFCTWRVFDVLGFGGWGVGFGVWCFGI